MPALRDWLTGTLALVILAGGSILLYRLFLIIKRRLLWRVRRKLTLSYVFIGFVPALLIIAFFLLCGLLLLFNVSSYLVQSRLRAVVDEARFLAQTAVLDVQDAPGTGCIHRLGSLDASARALVGARLGSVHRLRRAHHAGRSDDTARGASRRVA